jgi:hypothetical protein
MGGKIVCNIEGRIVRIANKNRKKNENNGGNLYADTEEGGNMLIRYSCIHLHDYTASQPKHKLDKPYQ